MDRFVWKNKKLISFLKGLTLFICSSLLVIACKSQQPTGSTKTLTVGISPWPGYSGHYVAMAKDFFKAEGVAVKEVFFSSQSDADSAFLAGRLDLNWTGLPNVIPQISRDSSIKVIMQCDYSNGADGIVGRNINKSADLKGKKVARENILFEELLLRRYLEKMGLSRNDVVTINMSAADAAAAFIPGKVDLAVTYQPWMTKAAKEGKGEIVFTSKDTNIIPDGIVAREEAIQKNKPELLAYLRAVNKAVKLIQDKPAEVTSIIAKSLNITSEEVPDQIGGVKLYDIESNKKITFNTSDPMNLFESLKFAAKTAKDINLVTQLIDANATINDSLVKSL